MSVRNCHTRMPQRAGIHSFVPLQDHQYQGLLDNNSTVGRVLGSHCCDKCLRQSELKRGWAGTVTSVKVRVQIPRADIKTGWAYWPAYNSNAPRAVQGVLITFCCCE